MANLETDQVKNKDTIGSLKHDLLETNEVYVKEKDQLVRSKSGIDDRHQTASVRQNSINRFQSPVFYRQQQMIWKHK